MLRKPAFAVIVSSTLLLVYCWLINIDSPIAYIIFAVSPIFVLWTAYTILRFGSYKGKELEQDEEWGYQDKDKDELGVL